MGMYLQIAAGLVPVILIFAILSIFQKKGRILDLICTGVLLATAVALVCVHFLNRPAQEAIDDHSDSQLTMVYATALEERGAYLAQQMLQDLRESQPDSGAITLCDALLHAYQADVAGAKALYIKAAEVLNLKDDKLLILCTAVYKQDGTVDTDAKEDLVKYAKEQMEEQIADKVYSKTAKTLIAAEALFTKYVTDSTLEKEEAKEHLRQLDDKLEEHPGIAQIPQIRLACMKLRILLGDYKDIAQNMTEDASYDELAIVSELYLGGMVKESSFTQEFGEDFKVKADAVSVQLEKVIKLIQEKSEQEKAESFLERLLKMKKSPAIYRIVDGITQVAMDSNSPERSKAFLQLAKFEYNEGNTETAEKHITSAMETVGMSEDDDYFVPMSNLVEIVTDNEDPEKLKQIADYVDQVTNHSSDEMVVKAVQTDAASQENTEQTPEEEEKADFNSHMTDTLNQTRIMLDITHVDASKFETVSVTVNINDALAKDAEELKKLLTVTDCGVTITDFTVEKVEFTASNILLCCDVSGSMDGQPIADLRNAVIKFVESSPEKENVALVTFSSGVEAVYGFDTDEATILSAAEGLRTIGGTNMYDAIIRSLSEFTNDPNQVNYILLLSDGQDGNSHGIEDMDIDIGAPARDAGILLYSLGLGSSVDSGYMSNLASVTGGDYLYVADSDTLMTFYEKLRNQAMNRYTITFKAEDTFTAKRTVRVAYTEQPNIVNDSYVYNIGSGETDDTENFYISMEGKSIHSLSSNLLYKTPMVTNIQAFGTGFTQEDACSVKLDGALDYENVPCTYVSETSLNIAIPGGVACGEYDVRITINGKTAILKDALHVVAQGSEKITTFGPYVFTSYSKSQNGNTLTLDSFVVMNEWLRFNGDVTLTGDLSAQTIQLMDYEGCYVRYNPTTAQGYAATLANRGEVVELGALGTVTLYNNPDISPTSDEYTVQKVQIPELLLPNLLLSKMPSMSLYPHKLLIDMTGFSTDLPLQDVLVKDTNKKLFDFEAEAKLIIENTRMDLDAKVKMGTDPKDGKVMATVGKMSIPVFKGDLELSLDTAKNTFGIDFGVEIPALFKGDDTGIGLKLEWQARDTDQGMQKLCPSMVQFGVDVPIKTNIGGVPITLEDFKLALEDIDLNKSILDCHFKGSMDIGLSKVSDYLPGLDDNIGDVSLLKLDDATLELAWTDQYIGLTTKMVLLDEITLMEGTIEAGRLPFTVILLDMHDVEAYGMRASLKKGVIWDTDSCDVDISGTGTISINPKLFAVEYEGVASIDIQWWIFNKRFYEKGTAVVGFYHDNQDRFNFAVIARDNNAKGAREYYLTWNKDTSLQVGTRKV